MNYPTPVLLVSESWEPDEFGVSQPTESTKKVYADVQSVTRNEFFNAGRNGLNPEYVITVFFGDYSGEKIASINGVRYTVYRTYMRRNNLIELYLERREGNV